MTISRVSSGAAVLFWTLLGSAWIPAFSDVVSLNPVADALVAAAQPTSNYGGSGGLAIAAASLPRGEFQSLMRFDTLAARTAFDTSYGVGQWSVQSVTLQLTATNPNNALYNSPSAAGQFAASWMQNDTWVEGTGTPAAPTTTGITFAALPSFLSSADEALGSFAYNGATSGTTTAALTLSPGLGADLLAGNLVSLRVLAADAAIAGVFNSRNFGTVSARPLLTITAIPEPTAGAVLLLALTVLPRR